MSWFEMAHVGMHYGADGFWRGSKLPGSFFYSSDSHPAQRFTASACAPVSAGVRAVGDIA